MFLEFYKLQHQPFGVTPDPRFLYFGATHREAFASLLYAIETKRGFSALVAEPGMGKTSLLAHLLETLGTSARTAYLFQTDGDSRDLLHGLLSDLGVDTSSNDLVAMHNALNHALCAEEGAGRRVVLILDEAQNLDEKSLESVRLLSNFETSTQKLMHIVLAGQPCLAERLDEPGLAQLRQRVSSIIRLEHFNREETIEYIAHRLHNAGYNGSSLFSREALEIIARVSRGIPRNINNICFQALSIGFATLSKTIGTEILTEVVADLNYTPKLNHRVPEEPRVLSPASAQVNSTAVFTHFPRSWEYASEVPERSPRRFRFFALACVAVPLLIIVALSNPKLGLSQTVPGQVSESLVNAFLSSTDPSSDFVPAWPAKLKPPSAPTVETTSEKLLQSALAQEATPDESQTGEEETNDTSRQQSIVAIPRAMTIVDIARTYLGESNREAIGEIRDLNPQFRSANRLVPKGTQISLPADSTSETRSIALGITSGFGSNGKEQVSPRSKPYHGPVNVQVLHRETLFQLALEQYGKANWTIVEKICRTNPSLRGAYDILSPGQRIRLPEESPDMSSSNSSASSSRR